MRRKWKVIVPALVLIGTLLLFRFVLFVGYVPTESMEPALKKGSIIIGCRLFEEPQVNDIVVFEHNGKLMVKRVAAKGGDKVYHHAQWQYVPENFYYLLGDNSCNSWDSRYWDNPFIGLDSIKAKLACQNSQSDRLT